MNPLERAEAIFNDALDRPEGERAAFIEAACAGDSSLLADVRSLIKFHTDAEGFLEGAALSAVAEVVDGEYLSAHPIETEEVDPGDVREAAARTALTRSVP